MAEDKTLITVAAKKMAQLQISPSEPVEAIWRSLSPPVRMAYRGRAAEVLAAVAEASVFPR